MRKTKTQKGITLVALIITIVVLLILAVVSINSIQNEGIMKQAQNAAEMWNASQTNEQGTLENYEEYFDRYGGNSVNGEKEELAEFELIERYILGADKTGRAETEILSDTTFINESSTITDASTSITYLNGARNANSTKDIVYFKYGNKAYKYLKASGNTESVELVYEPEGREGTTVSYDSNNDGTKEEWVIITDRDGKVEIVSKNVMGGLTLGKLDTSVTVTTDLDGDGTVGNDEDIAIASYNSAITTINNYCKSLVTAKNNDGVRSVGGTDNSFIPYHSTNYDNWGASVTVDAAASDIQYEKDLVKLAYHGIMYMGNGYWMASRHAEEFSKDVYFRVRCISADKKINSYTLWYVLSDSSVNSYSPGVAVRPVVINPAGI